MDQFFEFRRKHGDVIPKIAEIASAYALRRIREPSPHDAREIFLKYWLSGTLENNSCVAFLSRLGDSVGFQRLCEGMALGRFKYATDLPIL